MKDLFSDGIVIYAFRYALGRKTYSVKDVIDYLKENIHRFSDMQKRMFVREIELAIENNNYGMEMDKKRMVRL